MADSKINIKIGHVEFSGEGEQVWLGSQLDKVLEKVPELLKIEMPAPAAGSNGQPRGGGKGTVSGLSIININSKLSSKSGGDIALAAAAFLHFIEGKPTFTREEIIDTMKKATGYYKDTHLSNLTVVLARLEKSNSLTKSGNSYSIHNDKVNELNGILSK